ncbi:N-acetylglucosamine kinase [Salininema proteolyticum]|uniref:N-acetylglucosamine kinase n=1 Tax=Salininema proteolyticum TaxID=1607685 RepID=A0ABV8U4I0_9ACTN
MHVVGVDAGGTKTRAVLADRNGAVLDESVRGPGNPSGGKENRAVEAIAGAVLDVLGTVGEADGICVGTAGIASLAPVSHRMFTALLADRTGTDRVLAVPDPVIAFAAGTRAENGSVLIAGTGAVAMRVAARRTIASRADGYGWQLGDEGGGQWIGREAVRRVLEHLDGHRRGGPLTERVLADMGFAEAPSSGEVVALCMSHAPTWPARFARIVVEEAADPASEEILEAAAERLVATARKVTAPDEPLVLAGSLLSEKTPLAEAVHDLLEADLPGTRVLTASAPVDGAVALALEEFGSA